MTATMTRFTIQTAGWERLARLRDALDLIAAIRELHDPFRSPDDFRRLLSFVLRLAEQFGVDQAWLDRWEAVLSDERLIAVVLAIAQYVVGMLDRRPAAAQLLATESPAIVVDAQSYAEWLPLVVELLRLVLRLRGGV